MPRKRPAPTDSTPRSRVTRRSAVSSGPTPKRKPSPEPESDQDWEDEDEAGPSTSQPKRPTRGTLQRGKGGKGKKSVPVKQEDDEEEEENEDDNEESKGGEEEESREPTPEPESSSSKKGGSSKAQSKKKKKKDTPPDTPTTLSPSPSPSRSPSPSPSTASKTNIPAKSAGKTGKTPKGSVVVKSKKKEIEQNVMKTPTTKSNPKRKKQQVEEESPGEKKLRERAERKARRIEEAKNRPKLTLEEKHEKLRKKKERRERRKQQEKEESMRQRYGSRKMKPGASKWNFGPISSINQRRRDEMMEFFPKANFSTDSGRPKVMNNFRKATVKYDMEVLNPFITCGICDGYIVDATTIIDCMHTFCKSCLLGYFEADNNTCPTCGTFIHGSHPTHYVTYDRAVNELVNLFVPQLEQRELDTRKQFLRDCREAVGIDTAAEDRERAERLEKERITGTNRCYPLEHPCFSHHRDDCQVVVNLLPGTPNVPLITRPFIRCSEMTTMNTIKKYISLQVWDDMNRYADLDMFCDGQLMGKDFSIRFVWMMKRRGQPKSEPLVIRYHMIKN